jgi:hypothetical protein
MAGLASISVYLSHQFEDWCSIVWSGHCLSFIAGILVDSPCKQALPDDDECL